MFDNIGSFEAHKAKIIIVGPGGTGNNTITALTERGIQGAETVAVNTDAKHLSISKAGRKIFIGKSLTKGLGAGGYPEVGKNACLENKDEIKNMVKGCDMLFLTCGLGGGTGTGSAPVIARFAKEAGALVIAAVTLPFRLEGARILKAEEGLAELRNNCDTVIAIENQRLLMVAKGQPLKAAFAIADGLIANMIKGITETISVPSLVNLDYADVRAIMQHGGVAAIGIRESESENRAEEAVKSALEHPLIDVDYHGASGALIQVVCGDDIRLDEINRVGEIVQSYMDPHAQVIWGARVLPEMKHKIQVITILTGVKSPYILGPVNKDKAMLEKTLDIRIIK